MAHNTRPENRETSGAAHGRAPSARAVADSVDAIRQQLAHVLAIVHVNANLLNETYHFDRGEPDLEFQERTVVVCTGSKAQLEHSVRLLSLIAELRRAKESAGFFDSLAPQEQQGWVNDLAGRTQLAPVDAPYICVLDTGVNRGHDLLAQSLAETDMHTIEPDWTTAGPWNRTCRHRALRRPHRSIADHRASIATRSP